MSEESVKFLGTRVWMTDGLSHHVGSENQTCVSGIVAKCS